MAQSCKIRLEHLKMIQVAHLSVLLWLGEEKIWQLWEKNLAKTVCSNVCDDLNGDGLRHAGVCWEDWWEGIANRPNLVSHEPPNGTATTQTAGGGWEEEGGEHNERRNGGDEKLKPSLTQCRGIIKILRETLGPQRDEQPNGGINLYLSPLAFISREDKRGKELIRWASVRLGNSGNSAETAFKSHFSISSPLLSMLYSHLKDLSTVEKEAWRVCKSWLLQLSSSAC